MFFSFVQWFAVVLIAGIVVFWGFRTLTPVRQLLLPMWLPLSVIVIAGLALFATEQGRDLGVGLLGADQLKLFLLALALFYWATGSWHAARLGLNRRFGADRRRWPDGYEPWLRWLPRLVGACVHLFAALSLALAARRVIPPDAEPILGVPVWLLAFVPPAMIVVSVFILWRHDQRYVAARDAFDKIRAAGDADPDARAALDRARAQARRVVWMIIATGFAIALILFLLGDRLPGSLAPATGWVLASAAAFLLIVSHRRAVGQWVLERRSIPDDVKRRLALAFEEKDHRHALSSSVLALCLSIVALVVGIWAWWDPVSLGKATGSMVLGFFAFGAYIAVIDLMRIVSGSGPRFAALAAFLLLLAAATPATRDYHRVRLCGDSLAPCPNATAAAGEARTSIEDRPTAAKAAEAWFAQAEEGWGEDTPVPMLIVATAGGGIRAAYWTATVLEQIEKELSREVLRRHLFAISGVSGGSVGALTYMATLSDGPVSERPPAEFLQDDFLAPAIAALAFVDGPSIFLPDMAQGDRGYALERAWEIASDDVLARPFLSFFPSGDALRNGTPWRPALLLNATHQDTGRRVITSHLQIERRVFLDAFDAHALVKADMPASAAGHNSARFTYVSPAGKLVSPQSEGDGQGHFGFLLDGGYFENFGAITALQLLREARRALEQKNVQPIILQISSDPSLSPRDRARMYQDASLCDVVAGALAFEESDVGDAVSSFTNELTAPIAGIMASRVAHGTLASQELAHAICTLQWRPPEQAPQPLDLLAAVKQEPLGTAIRAPAPGASPRPEERPLYAHLAMCDEAGSTVPPLGWVLSSPLREQFAEILQEQCGNKEELNRVIEAFRRQAM